MRVDRRFSVDAFLAIWNRDFRKPLDWFGVRDEGQFAVDAASFNFAAPGFGLDFLDRVHSF
jgi:hypothetical protein